MKKFDISEKQVRKTAIIFVLLQLFLIVLRAFKILRFSWVIIFLPSILAAVLLGIVVILVAISD